MLAFAQSALGDEVVDAAAALFVARIPVLHRGVLDLGAIERDKFDNGRVQLIFIAHRRGATFEVTHVRAFVGDDECAFEDRRTWRRYTE
jgi:hypothetical protein